MAFQSYVGVYDLLALINDEVLIEVISDRYSPEDVFSEYELERWAEKNGYVKVEDDV